jgi:hypothetical protein
MPSTGKEPVQFADLLSQGKKDTPTPEDVLLSNSFLWPDIYVEAIFHLIFDELLVCPRIIQDEGCPYHMASQIDGGSKP